jgi:hypothetical protein
MGKSGGQRYSRLFWRRSPGESALASATQQKSPHRHRIEQAEQAVSVCNTFSKALRVVDRSASSMLRETLKEKISSKRER